MRRQSEHLADYRDALEKLVRRSAWSIRRFESRAEIARLVAQREADGPWPRDPDGAPLYPGDGEIACAAASARRLIESGAPYALRLDMAAACAPRRRPDAGTSRARAPMARPARSPRGREAWGDVILARKETPTSYHLSVVVDDALQGVTRGRARAGPVPADQRSTACCRRCSACRNRAYRHHRLIRDDAGRKLSKSTASTGLRELRAAGATPADIRRLVGLALSFSGG